MRYGPLVVFVALSVLPASWVGGQTTQDQTEPIGRVTAAFGVAAVETPDGVRKGDLNTLIVNGDRVRTNGGGVTVLLASRVVLKIDNDTTISLSESADQLNVILEKGTVHVFVGQRPLAAGAVCIQDPQVRAETQQGVFLASYDPASRSGYYACEHSTLTVESSSSTEKIILSPDKQLVVTDGQFQDAQELDRMAFNTRKQSLERLGQAVKEQGAETFRIRSRMFDTQLAINQLSEAGWIDASTLQAQAQQKASKKKKSDRSSGESESDSSGDNSSGESEIQNSDPSDSGSSIQADPPAQVSEPNDAQNPPAETPVEPPAISEPTIVDPVLTDATPAVDTPPAADSGVSSSSAGQSGNSGGSINSGPGNANINPVALPAETPSAPPVADLDLRPEKAPKLDLDVEAPAQPRFDLEMDSGSGAPAPKLDLDIQPNLDTDAGGGVAVPRLDLDIKDKQGKGKGKDAKPKLDRDLDVKGKTKGSSAPRIDLDLKGNSSGPGPGGTIDVGTPAPKVDSLAPALKVELAAPAPKVDLGLKDAAVTAPPKADLGLKDAAITPPAAPKIDLGLKDTNVAPPPKVDLGLKDVTPALAPAPKVELDAKAPAPIDIKTPTDLAPKLDLGQPAVDLPPPPKIDLGGVTSGNGDATAPKLDLDPKTVTDAVAPPKLDVDLTLDAPPRLDIPTDLSKGAALPAKDAVIDLPAPTDFGVDVTKDVAKDTTDATKDAIDVVNDITKDASGHDGSSKGKGGTKGKGKG